MPMLGRWIAKWKHAPHLCRGCIEHFRQELWCLNYPTPLFIEHVRIRPAILSDGPYPAATHN